MNNCQQIMTVAIKKRSHPLATGEGGWGAKTKLPVCSHLNATFSRDLCEGRESIMRKHFPSTTACSNLRYMGGKPLRQIFERPP